MNGKIRLALVLAVAVLIAGMVVSLTPATPVSAFDHPWTVTCTTNVKTADRDLWDDSASPGVNNEGGFFWIRNRYTTDETCIAFTSIVPNVSAGKFPKLVVRAAVNDGAGFKVQALKPNPAGGACNLVAATVAWTPVQDHSGFLTKNVVLPENVNICGVKIILTDDPDATNTGRTNAMVDEVRIWNGVNTGWAETFTGGTP